MNSKFSILSENLQPIIIPFQCSTLKNDTLLWTSPFTHSFNWNRRWWKSSSIFSIDIVLVYVNCIAIHRGVNGSTRDNEVVQTILSRFSTQWAKKRYLVVSLQTQYVFVCTHMNKKEKQIIIFPSITYHILRLTKLYTIKIGINK